MSDSLSEVTLVDCLVTASSAMAHVSQGWLWLGLLLILVLVTSLTLTLGHITLLVSILPRYYRSNTLFLFVKSFDTRTSLV